MDDKILDALKVDGEKLLAMTGEDHGPFEDYKPPSYSTPGRVLLHVMVNPLENNHWYHYDVEVYDWDEETGVFWINEGTGFDWWINNSGFDFELSGDYVIEGIYGEYIKGEWGFTDDDEDWYCGDIRRASDSEIRTGKLDGAPV